MKKRIKRISALCLAAVMCLGTVTVPYAQELPVSVSDVPEDGTDTEEITVGETEDADADKETADGDSAGGTQGDQTEADQPDTDLPDTDIPEGADGSEELWSDEESGQTLEDQSVPVPGAVTETESMQSNVTAQQSRENELPGVIYETHVQEIGWQGEVTDGETAGTVKKSLRMEALKVRLTGIDGSIRYRAHVADIGWQSYAADGGMAGTTAQKRQIEAVQMYLDGPAAEQYDIYYTVHIQDYGWLKWTKGAQDDSGISGSTGMGLRAEAIRIRLVPKGGEAPADIAGCAGYTYVSKYTLGDVMYSGHEEYVGDLDTVYDGAVLGSTGDGRRLESIVVERGAALRALDGDILYRVHVEDYGDQGWVASGNRAGTTHESRRMEALQMKLTGQLAEQYDIYYRVHAQEVGWMKWTKGTDEESGWTGSEGLGFRIEAVQIRVVPKGETIEDNAKYQFLTKKDIGSISYSGHQEYYGNLSSVSDGAILGHTGEARRLEGFRMQYSEGAVTGTVQYRAHVQDIGWQGWVSEGSLAGTTAQSKRMEAVQVRLTGELGLYCDVWYRVHIQGYGWLGWAKNGQVAGSTGISYRIEAIQIKLVPKGLEAPGANTNYYKEVPAMSAVDQRIYNYCQSVYNSVGRNLYSCYNWVVNNLSYQSLGVPSLPSGYSSRSQWYAVKAFSEHRGNCYCYAAAFYYLAKYLGYNAQYVEGRVTAASGGYTPHGWVVINGAYICDPEAQYEIGGYNFYMQPIGNTVLNYIR